MKVKWGFNTNFVQVDGTWYVNGFLFVIWVIVAFGIGFYFGSR